MRPERPEIRVLVAIPSYDGRCDINTMFAVTDLQHECARRGWGFGTSASVAVAPISVARSQLCQEFLESPATHLFFLDADIGCERGAMARMVLHPVDLVLGVYPERQLNRTYTVLGLDDGTFRRDPVTGLVEIQGGPAGFMCVRRHVIETMMSMTDPEDVYLVPNNPIQIPMLFKTVIGRTLTCSEDIFFCREWRRFGGKVWCDPDVNLHHSGRVSFSANFWRDFVVPNKLETT